MSRFKILKSRRGQALLEYTILVALIAMVAMVAVAQVSDQILDIWNDLAEDLDSIDDYVADLDVAKFLPESNEDHSWDEE